MTYTHENYLTAIGVDLWQMRDTPSATGWAQLRQQVSVCQACGLHQTRQHTVFGVGDLQADCLFVGEAPGMEEDRQAAPFVGQAGQLLDEILFALNLSRETVYIANVLKCRPPNNRNPSLAEIHCCAPYLQQQIKQLQPKLIVALGTVAAQFLLQSDIRIGLLRGQLHEYQGIPLLVTYHPAYLLRRPLEKQKVWQDLQAIIHMGQD